MNISNTLETNPQAEEINNDKTLAMVAHLGGILFGFIPSLIIYLLKKDERSAQYVTVQAKEALNFQITVAIAMFVSSLLLIILIGALLIFAVWLANIIFCIIAAVKTSNGENYRYPFILRLIK